MAELVEQPTGSTRRAHAHFKMDQVYAFFAILKYRGLKRAAHALGKDESTFRKRIVAAENFLGKRLFERLATGNPTIDGLTFHAICEDFMLKIDRFRGNCSGNGSEADLLWHREDRYLVDFIPSYGCDGIDQEGLPTDRQREPRLLAYRV